MADAPMAPPAPASPEGDGMEQYMRHCASHPYAKEYHGKMLQYAEEANPQAAEPPLDDPTQPPMAPPEPEPERNAAFAAPSATNAVIPPPAKKKPEEQGVDKYRREREADVAAIAARLEAAEQREARKVGENYVLMLSDKENFAMDEAAEVERFARAYREGGDEACKKHAEGIRRYSRLKDDADIGRLPVAGDPTGGASGRPVDLENDPESIPAADQAVMDRYARNHRCWDLPLPELAARALPAKYGKRGEPQRNGTN